MAQAQIIEGVIQPYAWGGKEYLANLLSAENPGNQPMAELWLGAHPKGPAKLSLEGLTLDEWIARQPSEELGKAVAERFNDRLPFLLKILDVKDMLSIQVHPNKAAAEIGFAREEANGPERTAPNRNYRDDNHKPELG
ncbi:MAG: mannose-6-phosphate isomerase, class I, partial [Bacteroidota bacterium]